MSARRLARQGLLIAEHNQPVASTSSLPPCPACRRSSTAATLPFAAVPSRSAHDSQHSSQQRSSSWAAISRAGQAIFNPTAGDGSTAATPASRETSAVELEGAARELVQECKLPRPDPHKAWALFQQVDLEGNVDLVPLATLHYLLGAIHLPLSKRRELLQVTESTAAARVYNIKVDLIRLRLRQKGGTVSQGDLSAMLKQYSELGYAPGVSKVWDEMVESGYGIPKKACKQVFTTLLRWIDMHERGGGREVAKVAAQPLVRKAVAMLEELKGDAQQTNLVLDTFFEIVVRARDSQVFFVAMKAVYGFDVNYPGADVDVSPDVRATQKVMGETEVCWVLEMLGEEDDLSRMMAVFEVFDQPTARPKSETAFFGPSFTNPTPSTRSSSTDTLPAPRPHPIGTRAFAYMVQTAGRLGKASLVQHYFDQLMGRWAYDAELRIRSIEMAVGIDATAPRPVAEQEEQDGFVDVDPPAPVVTLVRPLGMPSVAPVKPYGVPSTLVRDIMKASKHHYDARTSQFIRRRTRRLLQLMDGQVDRISAVMDRLEPLTAAAATASPTSPASTLPKSLVLLSHEIDLINFHAFQLKCMHPIVKADSNIIGAYSYYRHRHQGLRNRIAKLHALSSTSKKALFLRPSVRKLEKDVLLARILVVKQRLARLYKLGRARKGRSEFDKWHAEFVELRAQANGRGIKREEEAEVDGAEGLFGEEGAMGTGKAAQVVV